ncbi:MAG: DNA gyrase subunit A, partial [Acidobacteria bacterium]|nr:DNA gyrase subunit A [Acidobacteriota bacterium]
DEDMVITVTNSGYVKRSPLALYRAQNRGGKGRTGMATKEDDFVEHLYVASAHSYVLVFTESGRVHWLKVHQIPEFGPAARGKAIVNLLELSSEEKVATTVAVRDFPEDRHLVFATERGLIKKTALSAYGNPRVGGIIGINVEEGDRLLSVRVTAGDQDILLATAQGKSVRFPEEEVRGMGRATRGVRGIALRKGDRVVAMEVLEAEGTLLTVSEKGYGKRTVLEEYRRQGRGGLGIINLKVSDKTGEVIGVRQVQDEDGAMLITQDGKIIRIGVDGVSIIGRSTQGVKVMDLDEGDRLVALAKIVERQEEDAPEEASEDEGGPEASDSSDETVN